MKTWLTTTFLAGLVLAGAASAAISTGDEFLAQVQQAVQDGRLSPDQALLLKFQYAFDRAALPADLQPLGVAPLKCGTPLITEYLQVRDQLPDAIGAQIEEYLAPADEPSRLIYMTPGGEFIIYYYTSGQHAVPVADLDGDTVPDYVERMGEYFDHVWQTEVVELGFAAPPSSPYYTVQIEALDGIYGYTQPTGAVGATKIVMDNDYVGFPPNDDPEGDVLGAMKVTAAHEFKHATQYVGSHWSEGGWVEVDATWMEEIVYPQTNDYHNYLYSGSPISSPATPLDSGGSGSYEDCVWQLYMSHLWDVDIIVDLWDYRRSHTAEPMLTTYENMLQTYGSGIAQAWPLFVTWNYATGARHVVGFGYGDAADYPAGNPQRQVNSYPNTYNGSVQHLAANWVRCISISEAGKNAQVTFNGADAATRLSLTAYVKRQIAAGGGYYFYEFELDAANDGVFILPPDLAEVYEIGFAIGNSAVAGSAQSYSITVEKVDGSTPVGEGVTQVFAIDGNFPNPFNPSTTIEFALDQAGPVALDLYDLRGQKVRSLVSENLTAGRHEVAWDGRDDHGRQAASGTYLAKLSSDGRVTTHKLVMAK